MDIAVRQFEAGERDMPLGEVNRRRDALLGRRGNTFKARNRQTGEERCIVAVFADDDWQLEAPDRCEVVIGEGVSWAEAFARAAESIAKRHVFHKLPNGDAGWVDLAALGIVPGGLS